MKARNARLNLDPISQANWIIATRKAFDERLKAFEALAIQALQFNDRIFVIVDAQIELGVVFVTVNAQCGGLFATLVAAGSLACSHRSEQPFSKGHAPRSHIRVGRGMDDLRPYEHVAGNAEIIAYLVPAPIDATTSGVRRSRPGRGQYVQLPLGLAGIGVSECLNYIGG